jgi:hypothetical protein
MAFARATLAARRSPIDYEERVVSGERFLFARCRSCGERLSGISLSRYSRSAAERKLRFSGEHHLQSGCTARPPQQRSRPPAR